MAGFAANGVGLAVGAMRWLAVGAFTDWLARNGEFFRRANNAYSVRTKITISP